MQFETPNTAATMTAPEPRMLLPALSTPALIRMHQSVLPNSLQGIEFLYTQRFFDALQLPAERVAIELDITGPEAMRNFVAS